jgi:hypothetical protein
MGYEKPNCKALGLGPDGRNAAEIPMTDAIDPVRSRMALC